MPRRGQSFYIKSCGPNDAALTHGLQWLVQRCQELHCNGLVAVSTKQILQNIQRGDLSPIFSDLHKHGQCNLSDVILQLYTAQRPAVHSYNGPILVIYGDQKLLDAVDAIEGTADVLYIPWCEGEESNWAATWGAGVLGGEEGDKADALSGVPYVALQMLTRTVNPKTGIGSSFDYQRAVRTLETLFRKNAQCEPELIRRQLIRMGWNPKDAASVKELAEKIWAGRRPKESTGRPDEELWNQWQDTEAGSDG